MKLFTKSKCIFLPVVLCAVSVAPMVVCAQNDGTNGPPNVLVVQREFTKPGREGGPHEKTEGAFMEASKAGKGTLRYLAMTSLSGPNRALFFSGYASFADWEATNKDMAKNASMAASMDRANVADGDLLSSADASAWRRRDEMSMNTHNLTGDRYMQIEQFKIKPGHGMEWEEAVKLVMEGYKKGIPDASWVMFQQVFGTAGNGYVVLEPLKSMGEIDDHFAKGKAFSGAMGKEGMEKLEKLEAACIESEQTNLFAFNPKMSYVPESWVKAEPDYWKPRTMEHAKKAEGAQ